MVTWLEEQVFDVTEEDIYHSESMKTTSNYNKSPTHRLSGTRLVIDSVYRSGEFQPLPVAVSHQAVDG